MTEEGQGQGLTIDYVIDGFRDCMYDDLGTARPFFFKVLNMSATDMDRLAGLPEDDAEEYEARARETIVYELKELQRAITEHEQGASVVIPGDSGYRYGHFHVMRYIFCRWYLPSDPQTEPPAWFLACAKILNAVPNWEDQSPGTQHVSSDIVSKLIAIADAEADAED